MKKNYKENSIHNVKENVSVKRFKIQWKPLYFITRETDHFIRMIAILQYTNLNMFLTYLSKVILDLRQFNQINQMVKSL